MKLSCMSFLCVCLSFFVCVQQFFMLTHLNFIEFHVYQALY